MKKTITAALTTTALLVAAAPAAHAETYLSKRQAQSDARYDLGQRYGKARYTAECEPSGRPYRSGYVYTRWHCDWVDDYDCYGALLIAGHPGRFWYHSEVIRGQRCPAGD
jgi:hypothetical protein